MSHNDQWMMSLGDKSIILKVSRNCTFLFRCLTTFSQKLGEYMVLWLNIIDVYQLITTFTRIHSLWWELFWKLFAKELNTSKLVSFCHCFHFTPWIHMRYVSIEIQSDVYHFGIIVTHVEGKTQATKYFF